MPANQKYLTKSKWSKAGKFTAAFFGGFITSTAIHLALAAWLDKAIVWGTGIFSTFILWAFLILVVYWLKVAWKAWLMFLSIAVVCAAVIYLGIQ